MSMFVHMGEGGLVHTIHIDYNYHVFTFDIKNLQVLDEFDELFATKYSKNNLKYLLYNISMYLIPSENPHVSHQFCARNVLTFCVHFIFS